MGIQYPFKLGEPVWALMDGYPWWPARIVTRDEIQLDPDEVFPTLQPDELLVEFFNDDKRFAPMTLKSMRPFKDSRYRTLNRHYNGSFLEPVILAVTEADRYLADWLNDGLPKVLAHPHPSNSTSARQPDDGTEDYPVEARPSSGRTRGIKRRRRGAATSANSSPAPEKKKKPARARSSKVSDVELVHVATNHDSDWDGEHPPDTALPSRHEPPARPPPPTSSSQGTAAEAGSSRRGRGFVWKTGKSSGEKAVAAGTVPMDTRSGSSMVAERGASAYARGKSGGRKKAENGKAVLAANGFEAGVGNVIEHVPTEVPSKLLRKGVENGVRGGGVVPKTEGGVVPKTEGEVVRGKGSRIAASATLGSEAKGESALANHSAAQLKRLVVSKDEMNEELRREIAEFKCTIRHLQGRLRTLDESTMGGHEKISRGISLIQDGQSMLRRGGQGEGTSGTNDTGEM